MEEVFPPPARTLALPHTRTLTLNPSLEPQPMLTRISRPEVLKCVAWSLDLTLISKRLCDLDEDWLALVAATDR